MNLNCEVSMKLLSIPEQKKVTYFGIDIMVPVWGKFIVTEDDGVVLVFKSKPEPLDESNKKYYGLVIWSDPDANDFVEVARVDLEGMDWKETLVEI